MGLILQNLVDGKLGDSKAEQVRAFITFKSYTADN